MLSIIRAQPSGSTLSSYADAVISLRNADGTNVPGKPDIAFNIKTYNRISREKDETLGNIILLPANLFLETLSDPEHLELYALYQFAKSKLNVLTLENRREVCDDIQEKIHKVITNLRLQQRLIDFCHTSRFDYPDQTDNGTKSHHTDDKTWGLEHYIEATALSVLTKLIIPIWGELIYALSGLGISTYQWEKICFDLLIPSLEEGAFLRIYNKLLYTLNYLVNDCRVAYDKKQKSTQSEVTSAFVLTHNAIDDQTFLDIVISMVVVKRLASYECLELREDGSQANVAVYVYKAIKHTVDTYLPKMNQAMKTMPRKRLPSHDQEDNTSILDHASTPSKKSADIPVFVETAVELWELPRILNDAGLSRETWQAASSYYVTNSYSISPLCQALVATFVGNRFGGSKCIGFLSPRLHQEVVVALQQFLIKHGFINLAMLATAQYLELPIDSPKNPAASRIDTNLKSADYIQCELLFSGYTEKPMPQFGKRQINKPQPVARIDFETHIRRMVEWLLSHQHYQNMAPDLWEIAGLGRENSKGDVIALDEHVIQNLCRFYLLFYENKRPF